MHVKERIRHIQTVKDKLQILPSEQLVYCWKLIWFFLYMVLTVSPSLRSEPLHTAFYTNTQSSARHNVGGNVAVFIVTTQLHRNHWCLGCLFLGRTWATGSSERQQALLFGVWTPAAFSCWLLLGGCWGLGVSSACKLLLMCTNGLWSHWASRVNSEPI